MSGNQTPPAYVRGSETTRILQRLLAVWLSHTLNQNLNPLEGN